MAVGRLVYGLTVDSYARDGWPSPVEGAALEMLYSRKAVLGSNPNPSARSPMA